MRYKITVSNSIYKDTFTTSYEIETESHYGVLSHLYAIAALFERVLMIESDDNNDANILEIVMGGGGKDGDVYITYRATKI